MEWLFNRLSLWSPLRTWFTALALALVIAAGDFATGYEMAWGPFYLIPVALAAWRCPLPATLGLAIGAAALWQTVNWLAGEVHSEVWYYFWNAGMRGVFFVITALLVNRLRLLLDRASELSRRDPLTGLANRRALAEAFESCVVRYQRHPEPLSLAVVDLDRFKEVNDRSGHAEGDRLLKELAALAAGAVRAGDTVARTGGDEFVLLLPGATIASALEVLRRLQVRVADRVRDEGWPVTLSIGLAGTEGAPPDWEALLHAADARLLEAKRTGRQKIVAGE